jgi:hypothetical protein
VGEIQAADVHLQLATYGVHALVHGVEVFSHAISRKRSMEIS